MTYLCVPIFVHTIEQANRDVALAAESGADLIELRVDRFHYPPGGHTHWHVHSGGQLLHIVEGNARAQAWGEPMQKLNTGDTAITPPGEKHWHGATTDGPMTQLAITSGEVTWLEDAEPEST